MDGSIDRGAEETGRHVAGPADLRASGAGPEGRETPRLAPPAWPPGARPLSEALHRGAVHLTPAQSDALARLLLGRQLVELLGLRSGVLAATFRGAGYVAWRVFITGDGRVLENADASEPDPSGDASGPLTIVRGPERPRLGTILPRRPGHGLAEPSESR